MAKIPLTENFSVDYPVVTPNDEVIYTAENAKLSQLLSNDAFLKKAHDKLFTDVDSAVAGLSADINTHANNTTAHITAAERAAWNGKADGCHTHTAAQVGAIPAAEKGAVNGVATLGADGKLSGAQLPVIDSAPTFVYKCTGVDDDLAIQNIVNNFFASGTAMTMKMIITGMMGVQTSPANNRHIDISATNTRGAVCHLDFSDCHIPEITLNGYFLYIGSTTAIVDISKLIVTTTAGGILLRSSNNVIRGCKLTSNQGVGVYINNRSAQYNCVYDCTIIHRSTSAALTSDASSDNNSFINCTITSDGRIGVSLNSSNNSFIKCLIKCKRGDGLNGGVNIGSSNNSFINCTIENTEGCGVWAEAWNSKFVNCTIIGGSYGVYIPNPVSYMRSNTFTGCKIIGATTGIQVETSNTADEIKLIGCSIKGTSTQDIQQTTAASTVKWFIEGCSFSRASIIADGTAAITNKTNAHIYMPQYANQFSRTIE